MGDHALPCHQPDRPYLRTGKHTAVFTRQLWEGSTECLVVFRMASAFCRGWCPAPTKSARRRTGNAKTFAGVVALPRRLRRGPTLDETFGLIDTAEKSAQY